MILYPTSHAISSEPAGIRDQLGRRCQTYQSSAFWGVPSRKWLGHLMARPLGWNGRSHKRQVRHGCAKITHDFGAWVVRSGHSAKLQRFCPARAGYSCNARWRGYPRSDCTHKTRKEGLGEHHHRCIQSRQEPGTRFVKREGSYLCLPSNSWAWSERSNALMARLPVSCWTGSWSSTVSPTRTIRLRSLQPIRFRQRDGIAKGSGALRAEAWRTGGRTTKASSRKQRFLRWIAWAERCFWDSLIVARQGRAAMSADEALVRSDIQQQPTTSPVASSEFRPRGGDL